jgi:MYND finger
VVFPRLFPPELQERIKVGGNKCDCCGKTLEELAVHRLDTCSRCKLVYYCSVACGTKAWKAGHKKHCRKKHEILKGDIMRLFNLTSKPQLNGQLVEVLGPDPNADGRWQTKLSVNSNGRTMSISTEKLRHIRPVA